MHDAGPQSSATDPAAEAFEDLRKEVALVRSALTGLAAEYSGLEIRDYSQTLGEIMETSKVTTKYLNVIAKLPALQQTPDKLAQEMIAAGDQVRKVEQESLRNAYNLFRAERIELSHYMHHHRQAVEQDRLLVKTGSSGVAVGLILYALSAGPLVRLMPESWLLPERMAASVLWTDREDAGIRLIKTAAPERWNDIVRGLRLVVKNRDAITKCENMASKETFPVPCVIEIEGSGTAAKPAVRNLDSTKGRTSVPSIAARQSQSVRRSH